VLSSCSSDNDPILDDAGKQALTFTATIESDATRAIYSSTENCAMWMATDQISINGKTYNAQSDGYTTTFKAATEGQEATGDTYNAYFACTYDGTTATLPAAVTETWADGKFNMPMYATSTTTDLQFHNLCGVLKITVKSDQIAAVKAIKVSSATKAVSGAFTVNANNAAVLRNAYTVANTLTITYTEAVPTTAEGKVFYVAVPAQTYQELKILLDADGNGFTKSMTTKSATDITVERNKIYPITFAANAASATTGSAAVKGGGTVNWVQLWAGGPKFAEKNIGANSATDKGNTMTFTDATKTGDDYEWGALWCTPSRNDMEHLMTAAKGQTDDKVTCSYTQESGVWGFKFTGRETGYETNSVFFPAQYGDSSLGNAHYWSGTASGDLGCLMYLCYSNGYWSSKWYGNPQDYGNRVRPVLKN
ncbi:MAG: hypothetical protein KBT33_06770, partial [Prevotellaceae bacterium]|nr:hypothetical protein [Candidatus Minthosoma equi]